MPAIPRRWDRRPGAIPACRSKARTWTYSRARNAETHGWRSCFRSSRWRCWCGLVELVADQFQVEVGLDIHPLVAGAVAPALAESAAARELDCALDRRRIPDGQV